MRAGETSRGSFSGSPSALYTSTLNQLTASGQAASSSKLSAAWYVRALEMGMSETLTFPSLNVTRPSGCTGIAPATGVTVTFSVLIEVGSGALNVRALGAAPGVGVPVGVSVATAVGVAVRVGVDVAVGIGVGVPVGAGALVGVGALVGGSCPSTDPRADLGVGVGVLVARTCGANAGVGVGVTVAVGVGVWVGVGEGVGVCVGVGVGVGVLVGSFGSLPPVSGVGVGVVVGVGVGVGVWVGVAVGVGV